MINFKINDSVPIKGTEPMQRAHFYPKTFTNPRLSLSSAGEIRNSSRKHTIHRNSNISINRITEYTTISKSTLKQNSCNYETLLQQTPLLLIQGYMPLKSPLKTLTNFIDKSYRKDNLRKKIIYSQKDCSKTYRGILTEGQETINGHHMGVWKGRGRRASYQGNRSRLPALMMGEAQKELKVRGWEFFEDNQVDFN